MMVRALDSLERQLAVLAGINLLEKIDTSKRNLADILTTTQNELRASHNEPPLGMLSYTSSMTGQSFYSLITLLHKVLFERSFHENDNKDKRPGTIIEPNIRAPKLRHILNQLAEALESSNQKPEDLGKHYARCYKELVKLSPFAYGNEEVFCFFFTALTRTQGRNLSFDLRRISDEDASNLSISTAQNSDLQAIFAKALDKNIDMDSPPETEGWKKRKDKSIELAGLRFLMDEKNGKQCLITINGGYVPLDERSRDYNGRTLREHIDHRSATGQPISSMRISQGKIIGYIDENFRSRTHIDGISLRAGEPLLCMDVKPTIGLTARYENELEKLLKQNGLDLSDLLDTSKVDALKLACGDNPIHCEIIEIATERKQGLQKVIDAAIAKAFDGKEAVGTGSNSVLLTAGGAGSGKGSTGQKRMKEKCGTNFVTASLDDARYEFEIYHTMVKVGHHADDYIAVSNAAIEIRKGITERALKEGYNLLYDGSGIPWEKYGKMISPWKERVKDITVCAVECELYVPSERREEFITSAVDRAEDRFRNEQRALPYPEMINRHIDSPESYLRMFYDQNVDYFTITDNAGAPGTKYTLAEKYTITHDCLRVLNAVRQSGGLLDELKQRNLIPDEGKFSLREENIDFLVNRKPDGNYDILVITNKSRFIDVLRKASFDKDAKGYEELPFAGQKTRWTHSPEILNRTEHGAYINCAATR